MTYKPYVIIDLNQLLTVVSDLCWVNIHTWLVGFQLSSYSTYVLLLLIYSSIAYCSPVANYPLNMQSKHQPACSCQNTMDLARSACNVYTMVIAAHLHVFLYDSIQELSSSAVSQLGPWILCSPDNVCCTAVIYWPFL